MEKYNGKVQKYCLAINVEFGGRDFQVLELLDKQAGRVFSLASGFSLGVKSGARSFILVLGPYRVYWEG